MDAEEIKSIMRQFKHGAADSEWKQFIKSIIRVSVLLMGIRQKKFQIAWHFREHRHQKDKLSLI